MREADLTFISEKRTLSCVIKILKNNDALFSIGIWISFVIALRDLNLPRTWMCLHRGGMWRWRLGFAPLPTKIWDMDFYFQWKCLGQTFLQEYQEKYWFNIIECFRAIWCVSYIFFECLDLFVFFHNPITCFTFTCHHQIWISFVHSHLTRDFLCQVNFNCLLSPTNGNVRAHPCKLRLLHFEA